MVYCRANESCHKEVEVNHMAHSGFKPPYMSFQTFWSFVEDLSTHPLPPLIDRSLMGTKSGTDQANLMSTLKAFDLVDQEQRVQPALVALTEADDEGRKPLLAEIIRRQYGAALTVSDSNGTASQLDQCFRESYGVTGADTVRKSVTFFLHAARMAGVPLSPHFKSTRSGQGAPGQPRKRATQRKSKNGSSRPGSVANQQSEPLDAYRLEVNLSTGGTMTLIVNVDPINLRGDDRIFFYDIVDRMTDYEQPETTANTRSAEPRGDTADGL